MSKATTDNLRKVTLKATFAALPPLSDVNENEPHEPTIDEENPAPVHTKASGGMGPPLTKNNVQKVGWEQYWDKREEVEIEGRGSFNVYCRGESGPIVYCLHGGGYTGLTWSLVAQSLASSPQKYRIVAPDLRGHGLSRTSDDLDFSKETMSTDIVAIWMKLFGGCNERQPTLMVGHSMGAALAVWAANTGGMKAGLDGVIAIDVVEGTAIAALPYMAGVLAARPGYFHSVEEGINWAIRSGTCRCKEAAAVSFPSQLVREQQYNCTGAGLHIDILRQHQQASPAAVLSNTSTPPAAVLSCCNTSTPLAADIGSGDHEASSSAAAGSYLHMMNEDAELLTTNGDAELLTTNGNAELLTTNGDAELLTTNGDAELLTTNGGEIKWVWRTLLERSQPFWEGWYRGLSDEFLKVTCPKMLLLAGTDRLDKTLSIGQMQGKFQLSLMPTAGHAIQEDEAVKTAELMLQFLQRFRIGMPPMQFPKAPSGTKPVLPQVAGPLMQ